MFPLSGKPFSLKVLTPPADHKFTRGILTKAVVNLASYHRFRILGYPVEVQGVKGMPWPDAMFSLSFTLSNPLTSPAPFFFCDIPTLDKSSNLFQLTLVPQAWWEKNHTTWQINGPLNADHQHQMSIQDPPNKVTVLF